MKIIERIVANLKNKRNSEVKKYINGKLLDIGCGDNGLVRSYGNGVGVDVYNYFNNVDVVIESSANMPFENESFDTITIVASLNHIKNYEETLKESLRILKPNGKILITMPIEFPMKLWHKIAHDYDEDQVYRGINEEEERYSMPIREIIEALMKNGFKQPKRRRFLFGLNNLIIAGK